MRNLQTSDIFELARLIKKLDLKEDIKDIAIKAEENLNVRAIGFDMIFTLIDKLSDKNCENYLYEFLSGPFECDLKEVSKLDPLDLVEGLNKIASVDRWKAFLKLAVR